jgi:hypothetical protein
MFGLVVLCLFVPLQVIGASTFHTAQGARIETNRLVEFKGLGTAIVNNTTEAVWGTSLTLDFRRRTRFDPISC